MVRYAGQTVKTAVRYETTNPVWYETLTFHAHILPLKLAPKVSVYCDYCYYCRSCSRYRQLVCFAAQLVVQVWDWDRFSDDDMLGTLRVSLTDAFQVPPKQVWAALCSVCVHALVLSQLVLVFRC